MGTHLRCWCVCSWQERSSCPASPPRGLDTPGDPQTAQGLPLTISCLLQITESPLGRSGCVFWLLQRQPPHRFLKIPDDPSSGPGWHAPYPTHHIVQSDPVRPNPTQSDPLEKVSDHCEEAGDIWSPDPSVPPIHTLLPIRAILRSPKDLATHTRKASWAPTEIFIPPPRPTPWGPGSLVHCPSIFLPHENGAETGSKY